MTRIAILGATGSIGCSALDVVAAHPDRLEVVALAAGANVAGLASQVLSHRPRAVAMATDESVSALRGALGGDTRASSITSWGVGRQGLVEIATRDDVDIVLCASSGTEALEAVLAAVEAGKTIALANKEVLVMAGALVMSRARARGATVLPVDSEHNAIHQCLHGRPSSQVARLILTASGGPFRCTPSRELDAVTAAAALSHPTWKMGRKITIDSATLMNKGLEVIEARWLFDVTADQIDVVVHPQSIVHSMVEFTDGSLLAQLGVTDMKLPIQYAFSYPDRWSSPVPRLEWAEARDLRFEPPDAGRFPCLALAYAALREGGPAPVVLNAANEVAVASFLDGRLAWPGIAATIAETLEASAGRGLGAETLEEIRTTDAWARRHATERAGAVESKTEVSR